MGLRNSTAGALRAPRNLYRKPATEPNAVSSARISPTATDTDIPGSSLPACVTPSWAPGTTRALEVRVPMPFSDAPVSSNLSGPPDEGEPMTENLAYNLVEAAERYPQATALRFEDGALSYAE